MKKVAWRFRESPSSATRTRGTRSSRPRMIPAAVCSLASSPTPPKRPSSSAMSRCRTDQAAPVSNCARAGFLSRLGNRTLTKILGDGSRSSRSSSRNFAEPVVKSCPFSLSMSGDTMDQGLEGNRDASKAGQQLLETVGREDQVVSCNRHPLAAEPTGVRLQPAVLAGPIYVSLINLGDPRRREDLPQALRQLIAGALHEPLRFRDPPFLKKGPD